MDHLHIIIVTAVVTIMAVRFIEFLFTVGQKDERDEIIEDLQILTNDVEARYQNLKMKIREIQRKYVDVSRECIDLQIKYDELVAEKEDS